MKRNPEPQGPGFRLSMTRRLAAYEQVWYNPHMNLVMMTEGTGQGVHGRKTNVGRLYDLLVENGNHMT